MGGLQSFLGRLILATIFAGSATNLAAQTTLELGEYVYSIPKDSLVQNPVLINLTPGDGEYWVAQFSGEFTVSGSYHYEKFYDDGKERFWQLWFVPDEAVADRLPTWVSRADGSIPGVFFFNDDDVIASVVGVDKIAAVKSGKSKSASGRATIRVKDFSIGGDCDHPTFFVRFLRLESRAQLAASDQSNGIGCA